MIKLSVVIITFNEEKNIARCLESVKGIADEVVVVDSFSTDATERICLSAGAKFIKHAFEGHIEQKNYAITQAQYPHILSLDADEALDETLKKSIQEIKNTWSHDGYTMNRLTNYCGKWIRHCGWYPDTKLRLWDSRKGQWGGMNPHDRFEITSPGATTRHLEGNILHYSYYTVEAHHKQADYFTGIAARALFEKGKKANIFQVLFSPVLRFVRDYIFKLGILDGKAGLTICRITARSSGMKYRKLRGMWRTVGGRQ